MPVRLLPVALLSALVLAGCVDDEIPASPPLEVLQGGRALVLADSGQTLLIEHEPFDTLMTEPMIMELPPANPREVEDIGAGDKIQFSLVLEQKYFLRDIERLAPDTRLRLSATDSASTAAPDTTTDAS